MHDNSEKNGVGPKPDRRTIKQSEVRQQLVARTIGQPFSLPVEVMGMLRDIDVASVLNIPPWLVPQARKDEPAFVMVAEALLGAQEDARMLMSSRVIRP